MGDRLGTPGVVAFLFITFFLFYIFGDPKKLSKIGKDYGDPKKLSKIGKGYGERKKFSKIGKGYFIYLVIQKNK